MTGPDWRADVLKFWFGLKPEQWWSGGAGLDHRIKQNFLKLWFEKRQLPLDAFLTDPLTAAAAVILFDQFPRNMFRGHADVYATDHMALGIAKKGGRARLRRAAGTRGAEIPLHAVRA